MVCSSLGVYRGSMAAAVADLEAVLTGVVAALSEVVRPRVEALTLGNFGEGRERWVGEEWRCCRFGRLGRNEQER